MRSDGLKSHRRSAGEVAVRAGGLRAYAVSGTTDTLRQAATEVAITAYCVGTGDRAAVLRAAGRKDADRHADSRHATQWRLVQLAIHDCSVTPPSSPPLSVGETYRR